MRPRPLGFLLLAAGMLSACGNVERQIRIVTLTELTGERSVVGQGIRRAVELAAQQWDTELESAGWLVELAPYDAHDLAPDPSAEFSRIAADPQVLCGIIHAAAGKNLAVAQILHSAGIPNVLPAETAPSSSGSDPPESLRLSPDDLAHGAGDAEWASARGFVRALALADPGDHSRAIAEEFLQTAERLGTSVTPYKYLPDQDPSAWLLFLNSAKPPLVYFSGPSSSAARILAVLESENYLGAFLFSESEAENALPEGFSSPGVDLYFSPAAYPSEDFSGSEVFAGRYRAAFGADPPPLAELGYDAAAFCLLPLLDPGAASMNVSSARSWILSQWRSGTVVKGITVPFSFSAGRPCRIPVYAAPAIPNSIWHPAPNPVSVPEDAPAC